MPLRWPAHLPTIIDPTVEPTTITQIESTKSAESVFRLDTLAVSDFALVYPQAEATLRVSTHPGFENYSCPVGAVV